MDLVASFYPELDDPEEDVTVVQRTTTARQLTIPNSRSSSTSSERSLTACSSRSSHWALHTIVEQDGQHSQEDAFLSSSSSSSSASSLPSKVKPTSCATSRVPSKPATKRDVGYKSRNLRFMTQCYSMGTSAMSTSGNSHRSLGARNLDGAVDAPVVPGSQQPLSPSSSNRRSIRFVGTCSTRKPRAHSNSSNESIRSRTTTCRDE